MKSGVTGEGPSWGFKTTEPDFHTRFFFREFMDDLLFVDAQVAGDLEFTI